MKFIAALTFACLILASCDARRLTRQINERYPGQFGNQFFPQQPVFFPDGFNGFQNNFPQQPFNPQQNQNNQQQFNPQQNQNNQQQFNPQQNQNGQQQQNTQRPTQQAATPARPTQPPTTLAPAVQDCRDNCASRTTSEYNPVCGSDTQNYHNQARLECARDCGVNVSLQKVGTCGQAGRS